MTISSNELHKFCDVIDQQLEELFADLCSGISAREDSRAFGAMIEKRITDNWTEICNTVGAEAVASPGRRTIYDFACRYRGYLCGFDVKTKDLDSTSYSDGGVCAVGNLLKFLANDDGLFIVVEFGHCVSKENRKLRDLDYVKVAPFHMLPNSAYRIENLGTGQVRLNQTISEMAGEIAWDRSVPDFLNTFCDLSVEHYNRVGKVAAERAESIEKFRREGFGRFTF